MCFYIKMCLVQVNSGGVLKMKKRVLEKVVKLLTIVAFVCAATPSKVNLYEPEKPESLR